MSGIIIKCECGTTIGKGGDCFVRLVVPSGAIACNCDCSHSVYLCVECLFKETIYVQDAGVYRPLRNDDQHVDGFIKISEHWCQIFGPYGEEASAANA